MIDVNYKKELAIKYFMEGYNCSQALCLAFLDEVGLNKSDLLKLSSPFGGGMSRLREACGAVSGMLIIAGLLFGYDDIDDNKKATLYQKIQHIALQFENNNKSLICRELLNKPKGHDSPIPSKRTPDFYNTRPCAKLIGDAALILAKFINEEK